MASITREDVDRSVAIYDDLIGGLDDGHDMALSLYWLRYGDKRYAIPIVVMLAEAVANGASDNELTRLAIMRDVKHSTGLSAVRKLHGLGLHVELDHGREQFKLGARYCSVEFSADGIPHVAHAHYDVETRGNQLVAFSDPPTVLATLSFANGIDPRGWTLRGVLERVAQAYDRNAPQSSEAKLLLRSTRRSLANYVPAGFRVQGSGGQGAGAFVPWIAVFDPDETISPQSGFYVAYLFAADLRTVVLSLNQGVTQIIKDRGVRAGREYLARVAATVRAKLPASVTSDLREQVSLQSSAPVPSGYEAGNILARVYSADQLPSDEVLARDLALFVRLYEEAIAIRSSIYGSTLDRTDASMTVRSAVAEDRLPEFKPKSADDYVQQLSSRTLRKSRKHEALVRDYGNFLQRNGFQVATNVHPRDLVANCAGKHYLVEAKIVSRGIADAATREALAQLLMYKKFLYADPAKVSMLAVFNESVGAACVDLLTDLQILTVWRDAGEWFGNALAGVEGVCESASD